MPAHGSSRSHGSAASTASRTVARASSGNDSTPMSNTMSIATSSSIAREGGASSATAGAACALTTKRFPLRPLAPSG
jgi:hypothetical protein